MSNYTVSISLSPINYTVNFQEARSATIQVGSVTSSAPGGSASVTNAGTTNAAVFNFVLPRGATGPSAYDSAVANGYEGTEVEWLDSLAAAQDPMENGDLINVLNSKADATATLAALNNKASVSSLNAVAGDVVAAEQALVDHVAATDPHGDRAYTDDALVLVNGEWQAATDVLETNKLDKTNGTAQSLGTDTLRLEGDITAEAWTTNGLRIRGVAAVLTDNTSTGTEEVAYTNALGGETIAATNMVVYTDYITAFYRDPTAGANVTITNRWALGAESASFGTTNHVTISNGGILSASGAILSGATATNAKLSGTLTINSTSISFGAGAAAAMRAAIEVNKDFCRREAAPPNFRLFDDFPNTATTVGSHSWGETVTAGSSSGQFSQLTTANTLASGVHQMTTGTTLNASRGITLVSSGSLYPTSIQVCFAVLPWANCLINIGFTGGGTGWIAQLNGISGTLSLISNTGYTYLVASGLALAAGNFISGTRYRLFMEALTPTTTDIYLAAAPWNSSTWTTLFTGVVTHAAFAVGWNNSNVLVAVTSATDTVSKTLHVDWIAVEKNVQR